MSLRDQFSQQVRPRGKTGEVAVLVRRRGSRWSPLPFPRLDGSTWPDRRTSRASFAAATLHALVRQEAFAPETHDLADAVLTALLPLLDTGARPEDRAHMEQVCAAAAQLGAATGLVERRSHQPPAGTSGGDALAALWLASDDLPPMAPRQRAVARYLLQCGYYLARTSPDAVAELTAALWQEPHPAVRPGPPSGPP